MKQSGLSLVALTVIASVLLIPGQIAFSAKNQYRDRSVPRFEETGDPVTGVDVTPSGTRLLPAGSRNLVSDDVDLVADIYPGTIGSWPHWYTVYNSTLYFAAESDTYGSELWMYDGGTVSLVADINPGSEGSDPHYLTVCDDMLYFMVIGPSGAKQLWKYDGTYASLAYDFGTPYAWIDYLAAYNDRLYFAGAFGFTDSYELWMYDGTTVGKVAEIYPGSEGSDPCLFTVYNEVLYFVATDDVHGRELWKYDGNDVSLVSDINPSGYGFGLECNPAYGMTMYDDNLYFPAYDGIHGRELWQYDGNNVSLIADIYPGSEGNLHSLTVYDGALYFAVYSEWVGFNSIYHLWRYDGTGTTLVSDVDVEVSGSELDSRNLAVYSGKLYFHAEGSLLTGVELWTYDGTNVSLVADISPGEANSYPKRLTVHNGALHFDADDGIHGRELWRCQGGEDQGYSISGHVTDGLGSPIPDVTMTAGGYSAITDAEGDYTITGIPSGIYTLTASKLGYAFSPMSRTVIVPPDASGQNFIGLFPDLLFTPDPDGYSFRNWGDEPEASWEDFRAVYGSENVEFCNAAGTCWPNFTANAYFIQHFRPAQGGHCYGLAVTSLRFFAGLASPNELDPGASETYDLSRSDQVEHHIGQYQRYQSAQNIYNRIEYKRTHSTPNTVLLELTAALLPGNLDPLALGLINNDDTSRHVVVPYRASDQGNGIWWIYAYDPNDPGATDRYVEFNANDNSWSYVFRKFWWYDLETWSGDADDLHLAAIELQQHEEPRVPPWGSEVLPVLPYAGVLTLDGSGDLLVEDQYGNRLGFVDEQLVSEIPGAFPIVPIVGTFNDGRSPESYSIPISTTYSVSLMGEDTAQSGIGTVTLFGPVRSLTLDSLTTSAASNDSIVFNEQLSGFTYETVDSTKPFSFTVTYEHPSGYSERFAVTDSAVDSSGSIALEVITATESILYLNSSATAKPYALGIDLVSVKGVDSFRHQRLEVLGADTHIIDYANWPTNDYVTLYIDHESNGTIDETIVLKNEINRVYLPLVLRGLP